MTLTDGPLRDQNTSQPLVDTLSFEVDKAMKQWKHCTSDLHLISSGMSSPTKVNLKRPAPSFLSELRMSSSRSSQSVCRPWNRQDFQQRVSTFQIQTWFAKPVAIGSLVCARHGWVNIKADTLQCRGCKKMLVFQFKAQLGPQALENTTKIFAKQLEMQHDECCPWRCNPSPVSFSQVCFYSTKHCLDVFHHRFQTYVSGLATRAPDWPRINFDFIQEFLPVDISTSSTRRRIATNEEAKAVLVEWYTVLARVIFPYSIGQHDSHFNSKYFNPQTRAKTPRPEPLTVVETIDREDALLSRMSLSLTGWDVLMTGSCDSSEREGGILECRYCGRRIGLWNFQSTRRANCHRTGPGSGPLSDEKEKPIFHPAREHRWFCTWVSGGLESGVGQTLRAIESHAKEAGSSIFRAVECPDPGQMKPGQGRIAPKRKRIEPSDALRTIQQILDLS